LNNAARGQAAPISITSPTAATSQRQSTTNANANSVMIAAWLKRNAV